MTDRTTVETDAIAAVAAVLFREAGVVLGTDRVASLAPKLVGALVPILRAAWEDELLGDSLIGQPAEEAADIINRTGA